MVSRRSIILCVICLVALLAGFSGFSWLVSAMWLEHHPLPHQQAGSAGTWDSEHVWMQPTLLQKVLVLVVIVTGVLTLWSVWWDARMERRRPRLRWSNSEWKDFMRDLRQPPPKADE